jgi:hypothetical protein
LGVSDNKYDGPRIEAQVTDSDRPLRVEWSLTLTRPRPNFDTTKPINIDKAFRLTLWAEPLRKQDSAITKTKDPRRMLGYGSSFMVRHPCIFKGACCQLDAFRERQQTTAVKCLTYQARMHSKNGGHRKGQENVKDHLKIHNPLVANGMHIMREARNYWY